MPYIDGFVIPVPIANKEAYREEAARFWPIFRDHGALEVWECWGEDLPAGEVTSFPMAVKLEPGEAVVFSWVLWPDRETRLAAHDGMMNDPRMKEGTQPFDGKRLIYGSFDPLFTAGSH